MPSFYHGSGHAHQQAGYDVEHAYAASQSYPYVQDVPSWDSCTANDASYDFGMGHADPYNHYKRSGLPSMPTYFDQDSACNNQVPSLRSHNMGPTLPPLSGNGQYGFNANSTIGNYPRPNTGTYQYAEKKVGQEEKSVGGVSAKLDYEMEMMIDFVGESATGMHDLYRTRVQIGDIDFVRSIKPGTYYSPQFRKWLSSVLNATRLPKATILLSLSYLSIRLRQFSAENNFDENHLVKLVTVALVLGSKFLDDNTFQNKSWSEVSNLQIQILNSYERSWLQAFEHRLHHDPTSAAGYNEWEEQWTGFQRRVASSANPTLSAVNTNLRPFDSIRRQRSTPHLSVNNQTYPTMTGYPVEPMSATASTFNGPGFGFDYYRPPGIEQSPSSAGHSGPATPEYYGPPAFWSMMDHRRRAFFFAQHQHPYQSGLVATPPYQAWNCHAFGCRCPACIQHPVSSSTYQGPIVVG